ncbi:RING/U-box superfamily protein [Parasponia andersonii]|uniref:RING/U-box superfamily protein n=1 Tax=Parasponia andersonii TaxID=3476 RepID=A0A2P5DC18_PARAD|nr:RING/U-box superfamily protein [Parasponia andersonii]
MEGGGGGGTGCRITGSDRPRLTLLDQMSAVADGRDLAGLTLDDILTAEKRALHLQRASPSPSPTRPHAPPPPITAARTLLDIIRDEDPKSGSCKGFIATNKDKKSWKSFKDRLRLKRSGSGAAWTSSVHTPTSDILVPTSRSQISRHNSAVRNLAEPAAEAAHDMAHPDDASSESNGGSGGRYNHRPQISRRSSTRFVANTASFRQSDDGGGDEGDRPAIAAQVPSLRPQMSRRHSTRYSPVAMDDSNSGAVTDPMEPPPAREGSRRLSVVLAEERSLSAREAVAAQEAAEAEAAAAADEAEAVATPEAGVAPEAGPGQQARMSLMDLLEETDRQMGFVGSRLCSRELWVSRGNCPLCNGFILEILDIF